MNDATKTTNGRPTLKDLLPLVQWEESSTAFGLGNQVKENTPGSIEGGVELFEIDGFDISDLPYFASIEDDEVADDEAALVAKGLCAAIIHRVNTFDDLLDALRMAREEIQSLFLDHVYETAEEYQEGVKDNAYLTAISAAIQKAEAIYEPR